MKVDAQKLTDSFKFIDNVPLNVVIESSQYVFVEAKGGKLTLRLAGIASAQAEMECEGDAKFLVDRRALGAFLTRTKETVTFENTEKGMVLRSGNSRLELAQPTSKPGGYSDRKNNPAHKLKLEAGLLALLSEYAKASPGEPHMEVVCFSKSYGVFATDSLVVTACLDKTVATDCRIPKFISSLVGKLGTEDALVEKEGATIRVENGWLYQPLPADGAKYPLEQIKGVLENIRNQTGFLSVSASALYDAIRPFQNYAWAADGSLSIQCTPAKKLTEVLRLQLDVPAVKVEFSVAIKGTAKMPEKWSWPLEKILPWLEFVKELENNQVAVGMHEHLRFFKCKDGERLHCLIVAGVD